MDTRVSDRDRVRSAHGRVEEPWNITDFDDFVGYDYQSESPSHRDRRDLRVEGMATFCLWIFIDSISSNHWQIGVNIVGLLNRF